MKYYLDCEFDNQGAASPLLSMGLFSITGKSLYITTEYAHLGIIHDPWVTRHVMPFLFNVPGNAIEHLHTAVPRNAVPQCLYDYFRGDTDPHVLADWPVDIGYLCDGLITGPGTMIALERMKFSVVRVDPYAIAGHKVPGAVRHNSWWDAMVLRAAMQEGVR